MPATVEILTIPIGSQLVSTINKRIDPPEPDSKNDFRVLLIFSENVTGLTETNIAVSAVDSRNRAVSGASLVSLEGRNSVWMATIRPTADEWNRDGDGRGECCFTGESTDFKR